MGLGGAVLGAAGLSAGGSLIGAGIQSNAAQTAAQEQLQGTQEAIAAQESMFGQSQAALSPFFKAGQNVLPTLQSLLTPGPSQTSTLSQLPGFQFQSQWGTKQAQNALAAQGLGGSTGPLAKAISDYNQGLAGTSFSNLTGQLQNFANMGAGSASALAGNATMVGQGIGQSATAGANAIASGTLGSANAISGGITGATSGIGNALLLQGILGGGALAGGGDATARIFNNFSPTNFEG